MRLLLFCCIFLYLVGVIQAAPTTNTTNTTTNDSLKAPSFTARDLWTIISSSVVTLFACIYTAIHPNVPSPKDSPGSILLRRLGIMVMALIAPELIVSWAMRQWLSACQITRQFNELGYPIVRLEQPEEKKSVEAPMQRQNRLIHLLMVLAKSVSSVLVSLWRFPGTLARWVKRSIRAYFSEQYEDYAWTDTHSFFVLMGGFVLYVDEEPCFTLRPDYILDLIRKECIDAPTLTAKQIQDKSKGNAISKGLVILQVAWFVIQLITRAIYQLETTQLETGTLAFAVLNFLTYAVWWNKPLNVQCPHPVYWKSTKSRPEDHIANVSERDEFAWLGTLAPVFRSIAELIGAPFIPTSRKLRVPTFDGSIKLEDSNKTILVLAGLFIATTFGAIHCIAWNFNFPTYQEHVLWRVSAVAVTFTPWLCFLVNLTANQVPKVVKFVFGLMLLISVAFYITARAVLLVLMFTTLRSLDPNAFKTVLWTSLVPHL